MPTLRSVLTDVKKQVSKQDPTHYLQMYADAHTAIQSIDEKSSREDLLDVVQKCKDGCKTMTNNFCRKLWTAARAERKETENHTTPIDTLCKEECPIWDRCIQNPEVRRTDSDYKLLIEVWRKIEKIGDKEISKDDLNYIIARKDKIKQTDVAKMLTKADRY